MYSVCVCLCTVEGTGELKLADPVYTAQPTSQGKSVFGAPVVMCVCWCYMYTLGVGGPVAECQLTPGAAGGS